MGPQEAKAESLLFCRAKGMEVEWRGHVQDSEESVSDWHDFNAFFCDLGFASSYLPSGQWLDRIS